MNKKIESIKHREKRAHIPTNEEVGYEQENPKVSKGIGASWLLKS